MSVSSTSKLRSERQVEGHALLRVQRALPLLHRELHDQPPAVGRGAQRSVAQGQQQLQAAEGRPEVEPEEVQFRAHVHICIYYNYYLFVCYIINYYLLLFIIVFFDFFVTFLLLYISYLPFCTYTEILYESDVLMRIFTLHPRGAHKPIGPW